MKLRNHTSAFIMVAVFGAILGFLTLANFERFKNAGAYAESSKNAQNIEQHFVTFYENNEKLTIKTDAKTVEDAIHRAKIDLNENDRTDPDRLEEIDADNFEIHIYRARPVIITDGITKKYIMSATYDKKSLAMQAGFTIYTGDKIETKLPENILETGLTETYEIKRSGSTFTSDNLAQKEIKREKILSIESVKETEKTTEKVPEFVTKPDKATCMAWMRAAGIPESSLEDAYSIIWHESKCRYNAENKHSGAYGIPQALPGRKMASAGSDWQTNPITQLKWMDKYVKKYGGWSGAWKFWQEHKWY